MTSKETSATEIISSWRDEFVDSKYFENTFTEDSNGVYIIELADVAEMAAFLSDAIENVKNNSADFDMIKEHLEKSMEVVLQHYEKMRTNDKHFKNIKEFLKDNN